MSTGLFGCHQGLDHFGWRGRGHIGPTLDHIGPDEIRFKNPSFFPRPASKSNGSSRTGVEGAGPLANERRRRNFSSFALRHARSHLGPGPALPKLALDHSSPPQNGRPWTTLGDIGPTLDRVVQGWTKPKWQHWQKAPSGARSGARAGQGLAKPLAGAAS